MKLKSKLNLLLATVALSSSIAVASVIEDTAITAAVKAALILEKDIPSGNIEVTTKDNIVVLKGNLDTNLQAGRAVEIASSMDNVNDVEDELQVKDSKSTTADALITAKVKGKIKHLNIHKKIADGYDLHVETTNGVVHVFGEVVKKDDLNIVASELKNIKNVKEVKTNVRVRN